MELQLVLKGKQAIIQKLGQTVPEDYEKVHEFEHGTEEEDVQNHVLWHHVRDALYPRGIWDMGFVSFTVDLSDIPEPDPVGGP